jgi:hypothetical protein
MVADRAWVLMGGGAFWPGATRTIGSLEPISGHLGKGRNASVRNNVRAFPDRALQEHKCWSHSGWEFVVLQRRKRVVEKS